MNTVRFIKNSRRVELVRVNQEVSLQRTDFKRDDLTDYIVRESLTQAHSPPAGRGPSSGCSSDRELGAGGLRRKHDYYRTRYTRSRDSVAGFSCHPQTFRESVPLVVRGVSSPRWFHSTWVQWSHLLGRVSARPISDGRKPSTGSPRIHTQP